MFRFAAALAFALALLALSPRAGAESDAAAYRGVVEEAIAEFAAGHYEESRALFTRAHGMRPNARTLRGLGMAEFELRNYVSSVRNLEHALASPERKLDGQLRVDTERLLERARTFVTRVTLNVNPLDARVSIDGAAVDARAGSLLLTVGEHTVDVQKSGYSSERRQLSLKSGGDETLTVVLSPEHAAAPVARAAVAAEPDSAPRQASPKRGPWILTAASGALLVGGVAMVAIGFSDIAKVENARDGSRWSEVKDEHARAPILTGAGFAVSAVGAAGLIAGLVWGLRKPASNADREARARLMTLASGRF